MLFKKTILISSILLFLTGCAARMNREMPTSTALFATVTFLPTLTSAPSDTPHPPPPQPTIRPVAGTTSTQINVRAEPSTAGNILGIIPANTNVEILGKDPGGNWFQILYAQAIDGKGWVTAKYVTTANAAEVPVVGGNPTNPVNDNIAIIQQQINVRSGPGTNFNSLGTLNAQDVVNLIGKDANGAWLQIEFSAGPDGTGWVNGAFVQAHGIENIPIIMESGEVIGTGTPTRIPFTPTPTVIPAWDDHDSQTNPVTRVVFEPLGTHTLIYNGDVSTPEGDSEDWIQFVSYQSVIFASLECPDTNNLQINISENGGPTDLKLACGDHMKKINLKAGTVYTVHLQAPPSTDKLQYIPYTITIQVS